MSIQERENNIFYENDIAVTKSAIRVLRWLILIFPGIMIFSALGLFQSDISRLMWMSLLGLAVTWGPTIAYKAGAPIEALKYAATLALGCLIAIMASDSTIGIYMTYGLAMVFSIFYYDKRFTLKVSLMSFVLLVVSLYFRSLHLVQVEFDSNFTWFISRSVGFLMEAAVMTIVSVKIAESAHRLLESLNHAQKIADMVKECNHASEELQVVVEKQEDSICNFRQTNDVIAESAEETLKECDSSRQSARHMIDSVKEMEALLEAIDKRSSQMLSAADETAEGLNQYTGLMEQTEDGMKRIGETAYATEKSISSLEEAMQEVAGFAETIGKITNQTNLLALNASIEAARAGEMGKGFSVVADEVRVLADSSRQSSNAIDRIMTNIIELLAAVKEENSRNLVFVEGGMQQIGDVREKARELENLAIATKKSASMVKESGIQSRENGVKILEAAEQMQKLVEESKEQAEKIVEETRSQRAVTVEAEKGFKQVARVAERLIDLSVS